MRAGRQEDCALNKTLYTDQNGVAAFVRIALLFVIGLISATCTTAAQQTEEVVAAKKSRQKVVTQYTGEILIRAQDAMESEQYDRALADMNNLLKKRLSPFDRAKALELRGYIFAALDDYDRSAEDWEASLALRALPDYTVLDMYYRLAQVYAALEKYPPALQNLEAWLAEAETPGVEALFLAAQLYYVADRPKDALPYIERGLAKVTERRQSWYEISVAVYFETNRYEKAASLVEQMILLWPEKRYHYLRHADDPRPRESDYPIKINDNRELTEQ